MMNFEIFYMLQDVLKETLALDMQYVTDPTGDLRIIDHGLREQLFGMEGYQYLHEVLASEVRVGSVIHLQDRLHMNYFLFPAHLEKPPYISIGPFFTTELTEMDWNVTFEDYGFQEQQCTIVREFLSQVPLVSVPQAFSVVKNVLLAAYDSLEITVRAINLTTARQPELRNIDISEYEEPATSPETIYRQECQIVQYVMDGDYEKALKISDVLFAALAPDGKYDLQEYLGLYHWANALFRKAAQDAQKDGTQYIQTHIGVGYRMLRV